MVATTRPLSERAAAAAIGGNAGGVGVVCRPRGSKITTTGDFSAAVTLHSIGGGGGTGGDFTDVLGGGAGNGGNGGSGNTATINNAGGTISHLGRAFLRHPGAVDRRQRRHRRHRRRVDARTGRRWRRRRGCRDGQCPEYRRDHHRRLFGAWHPGAVDQRRRRRCRHGWRHSVDRRHRRQRQLRRQCRGPEFGRHQHRPATRRSASWRNRSAVAAALAAVRRASRQSEARVAPAVTAPTPAYG